MRKMNRIGSAMIVVAAACAVGTSLIKTKSLSKKDWNEKQTASAAVKGGPESRTPPPNSSMAESAPGLAKSLRVYRQIEEAPGWTVRYGKEFWHRPGNSAPSPAPRGASSTEASSINLGEVIDRVSHALAWDAEHRAPQIRAKNYAARFDQQGLHFSPCLPSAANQESAPGRREHDPVPNYPSTPSRFSDAARRALHWTPQLDETQAGFRTMSISRGDQALYVASESQPAWAVLGNTAQALLAPAFGVVEHFETLREGVAATWVFSQPLSGKGAVLVEMELTGLTYAGQTESGHHFADQSGTARLRIGNVTAVDATGASWSLAMQAEGNSLRVTLPESILAQAKFPLAIDPTIGPEFGLDNPVVAPAAADQQAPALAANGSTFLVVWEDLRNFDATAVDILGTRVSAAGTVLDPGGIVISTVGGSSPAAAANGTGFLVVWEDGRNAATKGIDIYGTRVNSSGVVSDPGGIFVSSATGDQLAPAIASSGSDSFVVWQDGRNLASGMDIYGTRVTSAGAVSSPLGIPICTAANVQFAPALAFNGTHYLVVWSDQRSGGDFAVYGARVTSGGVVADASGLPISTSSGDKFFPAVASVGTNFLAVWEDYRNAGVSFIDIYGMRVSGAGALLDQSDFLIGTAASDRFAPAVAASPANYFVVWQDGRDLGSSGTDIYGARVTTGGLVSDPDGIPVSTAVNNQSSPVLAFNGTDYLVAWTDERNSATTGLDIYGTRISSAGVVANTNGVLISIGSGDEQHPAVAANGANYLIVWQDARNAEASGIGVYGMRVSTNGALLDLSAIPINTAANDQLLPALAASGSDYLVVWEDYRNGGASGADIYGTRVSTAGVVANPGGIALTTAAGDQLSPAVAGSGNDYLVVWQDGRNLATSNVDIYGTRVSNAGAVLNTTGLPISTSAGGQYSPAVAFGATNYLVVWADGRNLGTTEVDIYGSRVSASGLVSDPNGIPISRTAWDELSPAVASSGGNFLVVWQDDRNAGTTDYDIFAARLTGAGVVSDPTGFPVAVAADAQVLPSISASGTNYLVAWEDGRNSGTSGLDVYGARVTAGGIVLDGTGLAINGGLFDQQAPVIASGSPRAFLVVSQGFSNGANRTVANLVFLDDQPVITKITKSGGTATITWGAIAGRAYRLRFKNDLSAASWTDLSGDVTATGATASKTDTAFGAAVRRFYQVLLLP